MKHSEELGTQPLTYVVSRMFHQKLRKQSVSHIDLYSEQDIFIILF